MTLSKPLVFLLLCFPSIGRSQSGGTDAPYHISYSPSKTGGVILFTGAKHSLAVDIAGDYFHKELHLSTNLLRQEWISIRDRPFDAPVAR